MKESIHVINVNITFRNIDSTEALTTYAKEKISKCLRKFVHSDTEAHVVLRVEKNRHIADVTFNTSGTTITASQESHDLYAAIDMLVDSLTQQLRKHKEKLTKRY